MKKRGICLLLAIVLIINIAACKAEKSEAGDTNVFLEKDMVMELKIEEINTKLKKTLADKNERAGVTAEDAAWKEAYKEFLLAYTDESQYEWFHPHFDLIYIDDDEVPELAIINYGSHADGVKLYTYYEDEVVWLGEYGEFGGVYYAAKDNIIASYTSALGANSTRYHKIENGKDIFLADTFYYSNAYMLDTEPDTELVEEYYIGKQEVSKSVYQAKVDSYEAGKAFSYTSYDLTYRITEENIQLLFMDIKDESWQEAYEDFLLSYQPEHAGPASKEEPHFNLAYVDEDDIPELIIIDGLSHSHGGNVYTWYEGKVVYIGLYGQYGGFAYMDQENIISDFYDGAGVDYSGFYKIEDGSETELAFFSTRWSAYSDEESSTEKVSKTYYIDNEEVTKAKYDKQRNLYPEYGAFTSMTYDDSYPIDESTIQAVFDRER